MQHQPLPECHTPPAEHDDLACASDGEPTDAVAATATASAIVSKAKTQQKGSQPAQDASHAFVSIISSKIEELERGMNSTGVAQVEKDALKTRKKQLREVTKYVTDKANSTEDRITFIQTKYTAAVQELLKQDKQLRETQVQLELAVRERDKAQDGLRRTNMLRDKLEELCRQLQKENKEVLEEARRVRDDELAARQAQQQRLQVAINDVTEKMNAQATERQTQMAENEHLRGKLGEVLAQMETFSDLVNKKDLETQLAQARMEQQQAISETLAKQVELLKQENAQLMKAYEAASTQQEALVLSQQQNLELAHQNKDLREQLEVHCNKYSEFQTIITKSNQTFDLLKKQLETSTKTQSQLLRDREDAKRRADAANLSLAAAAQERTNLEKQVSVLRAQVCAVEGVDAEEVRRLKGQKEALEGLCRTLTAQVKEAKAAVGPGPAGAAAGVDGVAAAAGGVVEAAGPRGEGAAAVNGEVGSEAPGTPAQSS